MKKEKKERVVRPLGYAMKVSELNKLITITMRMSDQLLAADENREKLDGAIKRLAEHKSVNTVQELLLLERNMSWLNLMLDGAKNDCKYIIDHFKALIAIIQMEAAERSYKAQDETISATFSKE